jgi:hypothetical protein
MRVASLEEDNLVTFCHLDETESWPDKRFRVIVFNATFQQYFSYIGGENRSTPRKPLNCR